MSQRISKKATLMFLLILLSSLDGVSQKVANITSPISHPFNRATNIADDGYGFVWIGTPEGLFRFNGLSYQSSIEIFGDKLPTGFIIEIFADSHNNLWVYFLEKGLFQINLQTFDIVHHKNFIGTNHNRFSIEAIELIDGTVLLSYHSGIAIYDPNVNKINIVETNDKVGKKAHVQFAYRGDNKLIVKVENHLGYYDLASHTVDTIYLPGSHTGFIGEFQFDQQGYLWVSRWYNDRYGLLKYDIDKNELVTLFGMNAEAKYFIKSSDVASFSATKDRMYIATNDGGLWFYDMLQDSMIEVKYIEAERTRSFPQLRSVHNDRFGRLWIGGNLRIYRVEPYDKSIEVIKRGKRDLNSDLVSNKTNCVAALRDGRVVIGTDNGISLYDSKLDFFDNFQLPNYNGNTYNNSVTSIFEESANELWIATWSTVSKLDINKNKVIEEYFIHPNAGVNHDPQKMNTEIGALAKIVVDEKGILWLLGYEGELFKLSGKTNKRYSSRVNQKNKDGHSLIFEDIIKLTSGKILAATSSGLWSRNEEGWIQIKTTDTQLANGSITGIVEAPSQTLYLITDNNLYQATLIKDTLVNVKSKLIDHGYQYLKDPILGEHNVLWLAHHTGLLQYHVEQNRWNNFPAEQHFQNSTFFGKSLWERGMIVKENLYYAANNGLIRIRPNALEFNDQKPKVLLHNLKINGLKDGSNAVHALEQISVAYDQNNLALGFSSINDQDASLCHYKHRLSKNGFKNSGDWIDIGNQHSVDIIGLAPGKYNWQLQSISSDGVINDAALSLEIIVRSPWYRSTWAYLCYTSLVGLIMFIMYKLKLGSDLAKKDAAQLSELDAFRKRFIANITHEFRTPLTVISGRAQRIQDPTEKMEQQRGLDH